MSMDLFLRSEDFLLDGGLGALSSEDVMIRLKSSEFFEDLLLPNTAATAAVAMDAEEPSTASNGKPPSQQEKIGKLTAKLKLERSSTGDELVPLNMNFRISSGSWIKDYEAEAVNLNAMHPSFLDNHASLFMNNARASQLSTSPPPLNSPTDNYEEYQIPLASSQHEPTSIPSSVRISSSDWVKDFEGESVDLGPIHPSLFMSYASIATIAPQLSTSPPPLNSPNRVRYEEYQITHAPSQHQPLTMPPLPNSTTNNLPTTSPITTWASISPSPLTTSTRKKRKRRKQRVLDETRVAKPTDDDVLFGRGPSINKHPGNKRFRKKALEFHSWYKKSSKNERQKIANLLVESVKTEGRRFLEKGKDGLWHEVIDGEHTKASQTFRDLSK